MTVGLHIDASEYRRVGEQLARLPAKMQRQALSRAIGGSKSKVERTYATLAAKRMHVRPIHVRRAMSTSLSDGDLTVRVQSNQIPVFKLGARQTRKGVTVSLRGSYLQAFIKTMKSGHRGVFIRDRAGGARVKRLGVHEVHGPNPAGELKRNPETYQTMLADIFDEELLARVAKEVASLLKTVDP